MGSEGWAMHRTHQISVHSYGCAGEDITVYSFHSNLYLYFLSPANGLPFGGSYGFISVRLSFFSCSTCIASRGVHTGLVHRRVVSYW